VWKLNPPLWASSKCKPTTIKIANVPYMKL
jgi:hypothetical protein